MSPLNRAAGISVRWVTAVSISCAVVIGCRKPAPVVAPARSHSEPKAPAAGAALVRIEPRHARIEAPHGAPIVTLAVTVDGLAAVSGDATGGVRLWPSLDGAHEPRLVELPQPARLALARDARGFLIAMLDGVGGLVLQIVDADGLTVQRASIAPDPGFGGVVMSPRGPLAWRADQTLIQFAADGRIVDRLAAEPRQRILEVAINGTHAIAIIEVGAARAHRARWLTLEPALAWGAWIDAGDAVGSGAAVSPSGARLATRSEATDHGTRQIVVIDTRTGAVIANEVASDTTTIGLADDAHVALGGPDAISWLPLGQLRRPPALTGPTARSPRTTDDDGPKLAIGGGRAVSAATGGLVIATPTSVGYLGYREASPSVAAPAPGGKLVIGVGGVFAQLDRDLQPEAIIDVGVPPGARLVELRWLANGTWLAEWSDAADGLSTIAIVDGKPHRTRSVRTRLPIAQQLAYEPSTALVAMSLGATTELARYDVGHGQLDRVAEVKAGQVQLVPVAPALAGGTQVVVAVTGPQLTLRWVRDPRALDRGPAITVAGTLAAIDRAGHAFVWQPTAGPMELVVYRDARKLGTIPSEGLSQVWPDPSGRQIAQLGARTLTVTGVDGTPRWTAPLEGVTEVLWLDDGTLAVLSAAGLARLDARGAVIAARCGWGFELATAPHPPSAQVEPVCGQLP